MKTEQSVIAAMIVDENCSQDFGLVEEKDFVDPTNQKVYTAIKNLVLEEKPVDFLTVHNKTNKQVDISYLASLSDSMPTTLNFKKYVEDLKDKTLQREIKVLAGNLINPEKSGQELAEYAESEIFKLREETSTSEFTKVDDIVLDVYSDIEDIYFGEKERGLKTGYNDIDNIVGGLRNQEYILLGARPSIGKTALAINISQNVIMRNQSVAFFSFEMSKEQIVNRLIRSMALVESKKIDKVQGGKMTSEDWAKLQKSANYLINRKLFIDENPTRTVGEMQSMCRKLKREKGLDLIVIDYLQKIRSTERGSKREQLEQVSNDVKNMAKILDVPILVVTSLSRANEQRDVKVPILSDLRESGQLEFDADVVIFLHRDYYHDRSDESKKTDADLVVAKNRNGRIGRTKLIWQEEYTKFFNLPDDHRRG